jgi:hypothetical protein
MRLSAWVGAAIVVGAACIAYRFLPARAERAAAGLDTEFDAEAARLGAVEDELLA